jgi:DnaJ domain
MSQAYPLQWPKNWPKTEPNRRETSRFKQTLGAALSNLKKECERLGGKGLVLSSNYTLGNERPSEPGVVAYFVLEQKQIAIPCDRWRHVEDNVHAIALTIEAMRGMERWGAKHMITAMFTGFRALPEKGSGIDPRQVLGISPDAVLSEVLITGAFRSKSKIYHPDLPNTGDAEKWRQLREAHDMLMQNVRK